MTITNETQIVGNEIVKPTEGRPSWKNRRRVIFGTLFFCAFCISFIMFKGDDTRVYETIVLGCFGMATSIIGFYVAGAAWTDVSIEKMKIDSGVPSQNRRPEPIQGKEPEIIDRLSDGKGPDD